MIAAMQKENIKEEKVAEKFSIILNRISDYRLKPRDYAVYCCFVKHSDQNGVCFPSRRLIAAECCIDKKTVREVVTENRKTSAQMQNLVEQAGKNQEQFILNCSETLSKSTETLDSTIEKLHRKILKIMIAAAVSAVTLSLLVCAVFWKLAV